ncbi:MAG: carbamoyltransferase HypF [Thermoguttaceae bacterium]
MAPQPSSPPTHCRLAIAVEGVVQGVGFRPFVYNAARSRGLSGWVRNEADVVHIEIEGDRTVVDDFLETLRRRHPPQARIDALDVVEIAAKSPQPPAEAFQIVDSAGGAEPRPTIPADLATCAECLAEIRSPSERRFGYPFTNCTNCGPRWSIIRQLPYDRPRTSMAAFPMCPQCLAEYHNAADRRFHAQPIACPQCGPQLRLLDPAGKEIARDGALETAAAAVRAGQIVALQGLGGFQLLVDATVPAAVARLRTRKHRPDKPLAVMFPSLEAAQQFCEISEAEAAALRSHQAPIVLVRRRALDGAEREIEPIAEEVAPGNPYLGALLPYTPLHHLLMARIARPIVCTSGNLSEEPMAVEPSEAVRRLGPIADLLLVHNRPIVRPVDDSVVRLMPDGLQILRRARGYAPLPIPLGFSAPNVLAVGGHLKNTVALALGAAGQRATTPVVRSCHVGDLDDVLSIEVFRRAIDDLLEFFRIRPEVIACDLHPDYASTRHAETLAQRWGVPLVRVQHHHAHVAACMAEHRLEGPVLGLAWDGTGYGADGTVWGGEALVCQGGRFQRVAHLRPFRLPGGDRAMREPRRSALGLLYEMLGSEAGDCPDFRLSENGTVPFRNAEVARYAAGWFRAPELRTLLAVLAAPRHAPRTSSMGRLFDAVAALCGLPLVTSFEGQAAMALEFAADADLEEAYPLPLAGGVPAVADWEPLVRRVLADRAAGEPPARISARFHNALAELAVAIAQRTGLGQVVLGGGCFQNRLLTQTVRQRLMKAGFSVLMPSAVPPGDGGIALGQVFVAAKVFRGEQRA